ncbi:hypothetical protein DNTS_031809 [Danionella cerebrum]|uniref:G-protein coupled receptors family 1 profile domain-containing protein n=1 Tax=Danionella cerebrum TaxID=2873325 RepID=A0A553QSC2_9TELE|nr:hypothetical protein DNTS_031809 [Danionella translucida]
MYSTMASLKVTGSAEAISPFDDDYSEFYNDNISHPAPCDYPVHGGRLLTVLYSFFFVVGFLGNTLVIWVVSMGVKLRSITDVCLLNLAIADLLLVSSLPFQAHYARDQWIFGDFMCTVVLSVYHIGFYSGIFFIVLMSVDRYLAVVHAVYAMRVRTRNYGILASMLIWAIATAASFPELLNLKTTNTSNLMHCTYLPINEQSTFQKSRIDGIIKMNVMGLIVPFLVITYCYSMILVRLQAARSSRKQAMRLVIVVMLVFFCCWAPFNISAFITALQLMKAIPDSCKSSQMLILSMQITEALAYSHSCINPFLYVFVGEKFQRHFFRLLHKTPISRLQFLKTYIQATGSVYSQTTSVEERSRTAV